MRSPIIADLRIDRRPLTKTDGNHREVAIDRLTFRADGGIVPVVSTDTGVALRLLAKR